MGAPATLKIAIIADAAKAVSTLGKVGGAADKAAGKAEKTNSRWKTMAGTAAKLAGGAALGGVVALFKTGADEQKDFLSGQAQLANGIKTTGGAAHVSVKHLEDLAGSIQGYSGQTDDSIVKSEQLLLTFTNIQNQGGKVGGIFDQATKASADMAAKMGGDASKYAVQLGKALNDPVKGVSALSRVGVSFTDKQKNVIKQLVKTGHTAGAQRVILKELNKEFGGSAKAAGQTLPGKMAKAKRAFEDISQNLVASFMPVLAQVADIVDRDLMPAFKNVMDFFAKHHGVLVAVAAGFTAIYGAIKLVKGITAAWTAAQKIAAAATKVWAAMQWLLNAAMDANPIVLIVLAIVALIAVLVLAYKKFKWFRDFVNGVWHAITGAVKWAVDFIKQHWQTILIILTGPIGLAVKLILKYRDKIVGFFKDLPGKIKGFLSGLWNIIKAPFVKAWNWIQDHVGKPLRNFFRLFPAVVKIALSNLWNTITKPFKKAWDWIQDHVGKPLKNFFRLFPQVVRMALSNLWNIIKSPFEKAWNWINNHFISPLRNFFQNAPGAVGRALSGLAGKITAPFKEAWDWIDKHVFQPIGNFFSDLPSKVAGMAANFGKAFVNAIIGLINSALGLPWVVEVKIPIPFAPDVHFGPKTILPAIPKLAQGGFFDRPTLAMVGEAGNEVVAPEPMLRKLIREELALGGIHITVNGALDPDRVARQIEDLLEQRRRRVGGIARRGTALTTGVAG